MSRRLRLLSGLIFLSSLAVPMEGHAAPTWHKVVVNSNNVIPCTKNITTGYLSAVAPVGFSFFYDMYGGGGGGGSGALPYTGAGGGGGGGAILIGGALAASANGGDGGPYTSSGSNGGHSSNADGTAITVTAGQTLKIYIGGGGGGSYYGGGGGGSGYYGGGGGGGARSRLPRPKNSIAMPFLSRRITRKP